MTDRELLEVAAKAAGLIFHGYRETKTIAAAWVSTTGSTDDWFCWNPLTDDGDALRLAVKLGLGVGIDMQDEIVTAYAPNPSPQHFSEDAHEVDCYAATRRAIVRAAAALAT